MSGFDGAVESIRAWRRDIVLFVRQCLKATPDGWQVLTLRKIQRCPRVAMKASKGPGKSTVLAWAVWWFLVCFTFPKVVCTSITADNLRDGLWAELAKWRGKSEFLQAAFEWTAERVFAKDHPEEWWASARTWPKSGDTSQQSNTLAGVHADNVLFIIDEAGGVPSAVAAAAEGGLANADEEQGRTAKFIIAGNPTHLDGPLYRACTVEKDQWEVIEISGDPDDPNRAPRVSIAWAREQIAKWGRDHDYVRVNVFGRFPKASPDSLIGVEEVTHAIKRVYADIAWKHEPKILGVDVAREGDDRTVILLRQGCMVYEPRILRLRDSTQIAGQVAQVFDKHKPDACFVDKADFGVCNILNQLGYPAASIDFGGEDYEPEYFNRRAGMWFRATKWVREVGALPNLPDFAKELPAPKYFFAKENKLQLESKKQIKKRLGFSPDIADALALTFAQPVAHRAVREELAARSSSTTKTFNPYEVM